ncbi:MAG: N-acetylmuramoyl-L-alanine amidase [Lachnospiraceae bacterium]|nr:N-acetylmuramoyl-L-alanine amidase [Lachnospiraceae bacterium]
MTTGFKNINKPVVFAGKLIGLLLMAGVFLVPACKSVRAADSVTVVIDPGHGGKSEGDDETNSGAKYHGLEEKNITLITALAMYDELSQYGNVNVYLTRDRDAEMSLSQRVEYAQSVGADVIISIHYNASSYHNYFGSEIFTSAYGRYYGVGHALAEKVMDEWVADGNIEKDIKTRIGKKGDYYGLIRNGVTADIPTIILEHGYLDNDKDYQRIKNDTAWRRFGVLDATAVAKFYGLEKNVVKDSVEPTVEIVEPENPVMPDETEPEGVRLEINGYNSNKGDVDFTLYAYDDESKLMYYGLMTGDVTKDTIFEELELWDGNNGKMTGTFHIQPGYEGKITAKVFNVYQLDGMSNSVDLVANEEAPDDEEDNAVIDEDSEETDEDIYFKEPFETEDDSWEIGGSIPTVDTSAIANAIDKNTESKVKRSYTYLIIAGLVGTATLAVAIVLGVSAATQKRRKKRRKNRRDVFDWADDYDRD